MTRSAARLMLASALAALFVAAPAMAQDSLTTARDLYASAQYEDALKLLDNLAANPSPAADHQSIDLYRTLCLLAVGRRSDADRAMEAIILRDPLYRPGDELSPRTKIAFTDARRRVLPAIVQEQYAEAKAAFDRKDYEPAAAGFKQVIDALDDPEMSAVASEPPLADLRTLAAGFHDLSIKAIPPPPPPPPAPPVVAEVPVALPPRIYTGEEAGVRPPIIVAQDMPRYPGIVPAAGIKGVVEIVIDQEGAVESAVMVVPVSAAYDKLVLSAASKWQFSPAMFGGAPVKFRKRIQINIAPPTR